MGKWMDLAAKLEAVSDVGDNRDNRDNSPPNVPNVPNVPLLLPPDVASGLALFEAMPAPKLCNANAWPDVVQDALGLVQHGWVAKAIALGWSPLDLFGGQLSQSGDPHADGLAVWLQGRRVLALTSDHAVATDANGGRHFFNRPRAPGSTLLWALGRGR